MFNFLHHLSVRGGFAAAGIMLAACTHSPSLSPERWQADASLEPDAIRLLPAGSAITGGDRILASESHGLQWLTPTGESLAQLDGHFESLDMRIRGSQVLTATYDSIAQRIVLATLDTQRRQWGATQQVPVTNTAVEGLCLYQDASQHTFLFVLGDDGFGEQWLVGKQGEWLQPAHAVRRLSLPPGAEFCQVDDLNQRLFVSESGNGVWAYNASPEADGAREPVALRAPFGNLASGATDIALLPGGLLILDGEAKQLHLFQEDSASRAAPQKNVSPWKAVAALSLNNTEAPEQISAIQTDKGIELLILDDETVLQARLDQTLAKPAPTLPLPEVYALHQTEPVERQGDAADDPAIWIHPTKPSRSRVLGTNKKQGLLVYDLNGKLLQDLPVGRLNNVDVRANVKLGAQTVDIAVASHRDHNSLSLFTIDRVSGEVRPVGEIPTELEEIYGVCLFQPNANELYAFANGKDGQFLQYDIKGDSGQFTGTSVRKFQVESQPEGCVADDARQRLFIGEEDVGVWEVDARAQSKALLTSVIRVGEVLHADVEGLAIYHNDQHKWLVISSQGNDSYVVLDGEPPYAVRGAFRVGLNAEAGIDGSSETDGLDVTATNLGGPWQQGLLVVQDGRKRMPEQPQNFKLVPWSGIADLLNASQ
jgi:3-phytase